MSSINQSTKKSLTQLLTSSDRNKGSHTEKALFQPYVVILGYMSHRPPPLLRQSVKNTPLKKLYL